MIGGRRTEANGRTPRLPRPGGLAAATMALLALTLMLTAVLGWQAVQAGRSHRAAAERVLQGNAAFAASEFLRRAQAALETARINIQYLPLQALEGRPATAPLPPAALYADTVRAQDFWCGCLDGARSFFVLDLQTRRADWAAPPPPAVRSAAEAEALAHAAKLTPLARTQDENLYGEFEGRDETQRYQLRVRQSVAGVRTVGGVPYALLYVAVFDDQDRPRAVFGLVEEARRMGAPVFERLMARVPLLPPSVTGGLPSDSLLAVTVRGPGGAPVWRSGRAVPRAAVAASETMVGSFAGLEVTVALDPAAAERLVIGGLPRSRLPLVLGLLALTAGLLLVAILQVRRQNELARLRADFVSGVTHELRTPLTQIRMFAELLAGGKLRTDEERGRSARLIDQEARRLSYLVENVLDFARAERRAMRIAPEPTDVAAAVRETIEVFAPVARSREATLRTVLDEGLVADVDRGALRQVLLNFLDNAVKYGPAGQTVTVGAARADGRLRIWVEDEGPGVPAAERSRVWEPYYRLRREAERVAGGSGIGLAVVRDLVRQHGGTVRVEDGEGAGARFVAEIPVQSMESVGARESGAETAVGAGGR